MMKKILFVAILGFLCKFSLEAQLPSTELYALDMKLNEIKIILENPRYLSSFNPGGYNNQPSFINEDEVFITSDWNARGLTDVYRLDMRQGTIRRITATDESEYSPTISNDGQSLYVVRQEVTEDADVPQILWKYPIDLSHFGEAAIDQLNNIGYFRFIGSNRVALFQVGPPHKLVIYDLETKKEQFLAYNIGRTLKYNNERGLYYVQNIGNTAAIRLFDVNNNMSKLITYTPSGTEDFEVLPNGDFIAGDASTLYRYKVAGEGDWEEVLDLSSAGINNITRIAAHKDKLIFVDSR